MSSFDDSLPITAEGLRFYIEYAQKHQKKIQSRIEEAQKILETIENQTKGE